jgi:hypothetical protein
MSGVNSDTTKSGFSVLWPRPLITRGLSNCWRHGNLPVGGGLPVGREDTTGLRSGLHLSAILCTSASMPPWLRDLVWYVVTLAATIGAFKLSEFITREAVATPLDRAELCWLTSTETTTSAS